MAEEQEQVNIEIAYTRRYNLGDYSHKEYTVKISGNQDIVEEQIKKHNDKLTKYVETVESLVEKAHATNLKKNEAEK
jgi:predicted DNA-binding protein YlxM (UPF0122 family)